MRVHLLYLCYKIHICKNFLQYIIMNKKVALYRNISGQGLTSNLSFMKDLSILYDYMKAM